MANPRRSSYSNPTNSSEVQNISRLSSLKHFLRKPHAFPLLLSVFVFLTWLALRLQRHPSPNFSSSFVNLRRQIKPTNQLDDHLANLVRFKSGSSPIAKDKRGWLLSPISLALDSGITGGALSCASFHVGEIRAGTMRGNHRHHSCNETFVFWGAKTLFRLENKGVGEKGYGEVVIAADEVAVAASPRGTAHLLLNVDPVLTTFFVGCQDTLLHYNASSTDSNVWNDF